MTTTTTQSDRVREFQRLHESGCFMLPNPWNAGSARALAHMGFKAIATSSAGFAWSIGRMDGSITLDEVLAHLRDVSASVDIPVNADFEGGFAVEPDKVGENVLAATRTGIAGLSIEDSVPRGDRSSSPLFEFSLAVERIKAARRAIDASGTGVILTGRSEGFIVGKPDLSETIARLTAYADAGADCLFAPGIHTADDIRAVVKALAPKPINVVVGEGFTTLSELEQLGVRRISNGGSLARTAWTGFLEAAREMAEQGTFNALGRAVKSDAFAAMLEQD
ncbi:MAG: isocitrate lyase/phosphoenolpyruvate mutase family protein [bacterium]